MGAIIISRQFYSTLVGLGSRLHDFSDELKISFLLNISFLLVPNVRLALVCCSSGVYSSQVRKCPHFLLCITCAQRLTHNKLITSVVLFKSSTNSDAHPANHNARYIFNAMDVRDCMCDRALSAYSCMIVAPTHNSDILDLTVTDV